MDGIVLLAAAILNPRARRLAAAQKDAEVAKSFGSTVSDSAFDPGLEAKVDVTAFWPAHIRDEKAWRFENVNIIYGVESCADPFRRK
jgi:hypothetical protein